MNTTEKIAHLWLAEAKGLNMDEVIFSSNKTPDFILPDGSKYEIKLLYKDKIILFPSQVEVLKEQQDIMVLVFARNSRSPMAAIPAGEIVDAVDTGVMRWKNIKLVVFSKGLHKTQVYLPEAVQAALDKYVAEKYFPGSRIVTGIVIRAISEFLEREGYLDRQGGEK